MISDVWYTSDYTYGTTLSDVLRYNYGFAYSDESNAITVMGISFSDNEIAEITYNYDSWDRLATKNIAFSGTTNTVSYAYKEQSMLVTQYTTSVGSISKTYKYTYDDANVNITEVRDANNNLLQKYTYDSLDRLVFEQNYALRKTFAYTYDNNGNILSETIKIYNDNELQELNTTVTYEYGYTNESWKDQLTSYNGSIITYDSMGNPLTYWDGTLFTWDIEGNLASLSKGNTSVSYKYNSAGIRTEKTVNGVTHHYTLDGTKILFEEYGNVLIVYLYDEAGAPIGMAYRENSYAQEEFDVYLFTKNLQGDIIGIYDEIGNLVAEYTYNAWGEHTVVNHTSANIGNINPFRYRGYFYDSETGFYYLNTRYYDPQIKRFISADSISYLGANGDFTSYNLYAYCSNNPVMYVDSSGTTIKSFFEETFGWGLIIGSQRRKGGRDFRHVGYEYGDFYMFEVGEFDKPVCFYWEDGKYGLQFNKEDSPYGISIVDNETQLNLTLTIKNGEGSIFLEEDKLGFRIAQGNGIEDQYSTGRYFEGYIYPKTIAEDAVKVATIAGTIYVGVKCAKILTSALLAAFAAMAA